MNLPRLALLLAALSLLAGAPGRALAAVPGYIQYDGMLLDDQGAPISELRTFTFTGKRAGILSPGRTRARISAPEAMGASRRRGRNTPPKKPVAPVTRILFLSIFG